MGDDLPPKEQNLFKAVIKAYEAKEHDKAIKQADVILSSFPEHGNTLGMKALVLSQKKDCDLESCVRMVEEALGYNKESFICWHILGIMKKQDKKYQEAIDAYKTSLSFAPENFTVLRDLAHAQAHFRDFNGFKQTCATLLLIKPQIRQHYIGMATACFLNGDYNEVERYLKAWDDRSSQSMQPLSQFELSEFCLLRARALLKAGDAQRAQVQLEADYMAGRIHSNSSLLELRAEILKEKKSKQDAKATYESLIELNPNNTKYYHEKFEVGQYEPEDKLAFGLSYRNLYPKASGPIYYLLDVLEGDSKPFITICREQITKYVKKGASVYDALKDYYKDEKKTATIGIILRSIQEDIKTMNGWTKQEQPKARANVGLSLARHLDKCREYKEALELITDILKETPTFIEAHMALSRIYKHMGDLDAAYLTMEHARQLEDSDRYLNNKATLYALRKNCFERGKDTIDLFAKMGEKPPTLSELQVQWFELEAGRCCRDTGDLGKSLRFYTDITTHYDDFVDDFFDFHPYCTRKCTLQSYFTTFVMEDNMFKSPRFITAATNAIAIHLQLHSNPLSPPENLQDQISKLPKSLSSECEVDDEGLKLLYVDNHLERAAKLAETLYEHCKHSPRALLAAAQTFSAQRRDEAYKCAELVNNMISSNYVAAPLEPSSTDLPVFSAALIAKISEDMELSKGSSVELATSKLENLHLSSNVTKFLGSYNSPLELLVAKLREMKEPSSLARLYALDVLRSHGKLSEILGDLPSNTYARDLIRFVMAIGSDISGDFKDKCLARFPHMNCVGGVPNVVPSFPIYSETIDQPLPNVKTVEEKKDPKKDAKKKDSKKDNKKKSGKKKR